MNRLDIYTEFIQGSEAWEDARRGVLTASTIGQLITPKTVKVANNETTRALHFQILAESITGESEDTFFSFDMERGVLDEPLARDLYSKHYAPVTEVGFLHRTTDTWNLGYSPDGLVGDDGLIEIKSRRPKKHLQTILQGQVPAENMAQLQAGLLVSGREWIDYISYCGGMPLYVQRVTPDVRWQEALVTAATAFQETVTQLETEYQRVSKDLIPTTKVDHNLEENLVL